MPAVTVLAGGAMIHVQQATALPAAIHLTLMPASGGDGLWSATTLAAIIGASSALATSLFKDWFLERLKERRLRRSSDDEIYTRYLGPLTEACEKLTWRTREIFVERRHDFLITATLPEGFNRYKRISTLYRLASLIGWIRGMNLELNALSAHNPAFTPPIAEQINALKAALADGPSVEIDRIEQLSALWSLDLKQLCDARLRLVAARFEVEMHAALGREGCEPSGICDLSQDSKTRIATAMANFLAELLEQASPKDAQIAETLDASINGLLYREALIYREWQDAIGDAMIERDPDSARRFRIIGYGAFSELVGEASTPWISVLANSLEDIDLNNIDPRDFRATQLRNVAMATASMLVAIDDTSKRSPVSKAAKKAASDVIDALRA